MFGSTHSHNGQQVCLLSQFWSNCDLSETENFQQTPLQKGDIAHLRRSSGCIELAAVYVETCS